uniref:Coiled-coil domain-containing protein n=1 Tax=Esox lucius TaxID=8010 RepID=A0AAY5KCC2_ESOLU
MTELEIDKSHLPGVQDVCHVFAVLEDGALAHNLQEQEIEQYYTTNIQKNQLVQNDIRIAKRLQDEEEEQSAQHRAILSQASRRLEEQDSEYARMIQEELQRRADEEARRREREDQEIAKRIQEEEKERVRLRSSVQESISAEAAPQPEEGACLNLGALQQVLLDEELARRLQEEEEDRLLRRGSPACPSPLHDTYTEGDFRVAQVAQDEEIARFMQKQEMKSKRRSCDLDCPGSWRDKDLADPYDRRTARERPVEPSSLRERLDSEGLQSPTEECFPDYQDLSPTSSTPSQQPHRNIAEELDPTFKARRRGKESVGAGPTIPGLSSSQSHPAPHSGLHESMEEPTFVPPTKRQSEKSGHGKSKEKKENCKHQ